MKCLVALVVLGLAAGLPAAAGEIPSELSALAAKAGLNGPVAAWCRAEFRPGHPGAFAVAVSAPKGGRYVAIDPDARMSDLGAFTGSADLACYSPAEARTLDRTIGKSETIHGRVKPRWKTTIVCGFVDDTSAKCWQYAPADRRFVKVGGWVT